MRRDDEPSNADILDELQHIHRLLRYVLQGELRMANEIEDIIVEVHSMGDTVDAGVVSLDKLAALVAANANDPVKLQGILSDLRAQKVRLATAIANDDPAAPLPPPAPEPPVETPVGEVPPADSAVPQA